MKPLAIIVTYNRLSETQRCLAALEPYFKFMNLKVMDNGSAPPMLEWLRGYAEAHPDIQLTEIGENSGCPRALNAALAVRQPGQAVLKIDNDVVLASGPGWLTGLALLEVESERLSGMPLAMVSAYYEPWEQQRILKVQAWRGDELYTIRPVIGHCVYHSGAFMDAVGYFDVLAPEHVYGFEDLLLSHKASALGLAMYAWSGWRIENIQRHSAIGDRETRDAHVEAMRPLYNARARALSAIRVYTNAQGVLE